MSYFRLLKQQKRRNKITFFTSFVSFSWGKVDSNHRTHPRTDLQSVAIAAMRFPRETNFKELGATRGIRTPDPLITNQLLWPTELQWHRPSILLSAKSDCKDTTNFNTNHHLKTFFLFFFNKLSFSFLYFNTSAKKEKSETILPVCAEIHLLYFHLFYCIFSLKVNFLLPNLLASLQQYSLPVPQAFVCIPPL